MNPGGVEAWKHSPAARGHGLDEPVPGFDVTPRQIVREIVAAANDLGLPHPAHIHCNQLGMPGNWRTTLETMRAVEGRRAHFTHIQFHSYGGGEGDEFSMSSRVAELAEYVNAHPNLTVDVGQVLFGDAMAMTADGAAGYFLHKLYGGPWFNRDVECESGCGVTPIEYRRKSVVHALQWAIGLEWYLLVDDPVAGDDEHRPPQRRLVPGLSADHPPADGPRVPPRAARPLPRGGARAHRRSPSSTASTRSRRSRSSPAPGRRGAGARSRRATSPSAPTPT